MSDTYPSVTRTGEDPSVAFTCLLEFHWFRTADSRDTHGLVDALVQEWRKRVAHGSKQGCYELAQEMERTLLDMLNENEAQRYAQK